MQIVSAKGLQPEAPALGPRFLPPAEFEAQLAVQNKEAPRRQLVA